MALHFEVAVTALVGAFACGAMYVLKGMLPSRDESFWHRAFISVFLSIVLASLVLILPGTFGAHALGRGAQQTIVDIAGACLGFHRLGVEAVHCSALAVGSGTVTAAHGVLPVPAIGFEILRTPRVIQGILRCFGQR